MAKVSAKRLVLAVGSLVRRAQTYTTPRKSIHDNLHPMRYIIDRAGTKPAFEGALINLDQSKAFYSVNHQYLKVVLKTGGFELIFREWITAVNSPCSVVKVNLSKPFGIARLVHQDCPLSRLLYILALEPMLQLRSISFEMMQGKAMSACADNVTVIVSDAYEVETASSVLTEYESVGGLQSTSTNQEFAVERLERHEDAIRQEHRTQD